MRSQLTNRINAFSIDLFLVVSLNLVLLNSFKQSYSLLTGHLPNIANTSFDFYYPAIETLTSLIIFISYFTISFYFTNGQTLGKKIFKLKVHSRFNKEITLFDSFSRAMAYFICMLSVYTLFIIPFFRKDKKGVPDWLSHTFVGDESLVFVREEKRTPAALPLLYAHEESIVLGIDAITEDEEESFIQEAA